MSDEKCVNEEEELLGGGLADVEFSYEKYENFNSTVTIPEPFLVVYPSSSKQVAEIATSAFKNGNKRVRVQGFRHTGSPFLLCGDDSPSDFIILDFRRHMTKMSMEKISTTSGGKQLTGITAQTGASMEQFLNFCEENSVSVSNCPIIGDATLGGVLAIGGHGQAVPAMNEKLGDGFTFGTLSNAITSFEAVVWEEGRGEFVLKQFSRTDPDAGPFLVHIGRAVITQVTLMVGVNYNLRVVSYTDIPREELFSTKKNDDDDPSSGSSLRTLSSMLDQSGRVDIIIPVFVDTPWVRVLSVEESKPATSKHITEPYPFSTFYGLPPSTRPVLGPQIYDCTVAGLRDSDTGDIWGSAKNILLNFNVPPSPTAYQGFVVITRRDHVQQVCHELTTEFATLTEEYKARGKYPVTFSNELRVTCLDDPEEVLKGAVSAPLSPAAMVKGRPDFNVAVWLNTFTPHGKEGSFQFFERFEAWAFDRFSGEDGLARPEWAKMWGYTEEGGHGTNEEFLRKIIPTVFGVEEWNAAVAILDKYDPHQVFTNRFLRDLLVPFKG